MWSSWPESDYEFPSYDSLRVTRVLAASGQTATLSGQGVPFLFLNEKISFSSGRIASKYPVSVW